MEPIRFGDKTITLFENGGDCVFIPTDAKSGAKILELLKNPCTLAVIEGVDWNRDLSPWAAKAAFRSGGDFVGGGEMFLNELACAVRSMRERIGFTRCFIAGYSLAGLFALWSLTKTDIFDGAASVSGSLWFDGFCDYFESAKINAGQIYFSLGDREKNARDERLAKVEDCTRRTFYHVKRLGLRTLFELNPGGHFNEPEKRCARAIDWLIQKNIDEKVN